MPLKGVKIAITGGAGFIGSHLVDHLLERDNRIVVIDNFFSGSRENLTQHKLNPNLKVVDLDIRDRARLTQALSGVEVVFHLATHCVRLSLGDPTTNHEVNATGTLNTLLAAREQGVKQFIYCSSSEVYGDSVGNSAALLSEDYPKAPTTVYGASKLIGEHYTLSFHQLYGLPATVVRPFNTYGPRSNFRGAYGEVIPRFAIWLLAGRRPLIFGGGHQTRDYTYVTDTVEGIRIAAETDELIGSSVNLAFGEQVSVNKLATTLVSQLRSDMKPKFVEARPGDILRLGADTARARRLMHWKAGIGIDEGLSLYVEWLRSLNLSFEEMASDIEGINWDLGKSVPTVSATF